MTALIELGHADERVVIINCNTRAATTLALLSALRYISISTLVIDCPVVRPGDAHSSEGDYQYFCTLQQHYRFDLLQMPLKKHGETLDEVFRILNADNIILLDSDCEILNSDAIAWMREYAADPRVYGSGFLMHAGHYCPKQLPEKHPEKHGGTPNW